jgi:two-component system, LytTR family, sensor kinase
MARARRYTDLTMLRAWWNRSWIWGVLLWAVFVLASSTETEIRGAPFVWVSVNWTEALKMSFAKWSTWGLLAILIIWIDRRLPVERDALAQRVLWHVPLSLVFSLVFTYSNHGILYLLDAPRDPSLIAGGTLATFWRVIHRNSTLIYWVIVGLYLALDYQRHLKDRHIRNAELERLLSDARLQTLRTQLHPHFLCNALNAVSAYAESEPRKARLMIEQLGELLRLSLEHTEEQEIPLNRELAFIQRYLQVQSVRFEGRLNVSLAPDPAVLDGLVPPFILQPLVENAIRHGTTQAMRGADIRVRAWPDNGHVRLNVSDNGPGLPPGWTFKTHAGIGLSNTRERLRRLYGNDSALVISQVPGGGVSVELSLPYNPA